MDSLKDRGSKKWTAIMLPEHVEMLKEMWEEDEKVDKPILDEQQKMEIDLMIHAAINDDITVRIKYYSHGFINEITGNILYINRIHKSLYIEDIELMLDDVLNVELLE